MAQDPSNAGGNSYTLDNVTFPTGRSKIQSIFNAIRSTNKGSSAPDLVAGQFWIDDSGGATWIMYFYDGSNNINFATIDTNNNTINFTDSAQDIITDTTPQLGGDLDVNGNSIISASNGNIAITPNGTGKVILDGLSHPTSDGTNGQFLKTDGAGNLSFGTVTTDLVGDTTPQLGGDLDLNSNDITGTGNINITGAVTMSGDLTVNGTTTTINSTTLTVDDKNIVLASGAADSSAADGSGLTVDGASATLTYTHSGTKWNVNKDFDVTGNIIVSGTVDGRDLQTDGTKLDGIEASATADQTASEIRTLVDSATDSNVFTDADHTKLNAIEANATADQTDAEIRTAVESATDSNVFTDADHTKLNGIETSATADQTGAEIKAAYEGEADTNAFTDALLTKLNGIETSADVTDATNVDAAGAIMNSDVATKGQLIVGDGTGDPTILSVGADGLYLKADSSTASGVAWASVSGGSSVGGANGVDFDDDVKIRLGTGNDFEIFHDSSDNSSIIKETGANRLDIRATNLILNNAANNKTYMNCIDGGQVQLFHNGTAKLETASTGVTVTGAVDATSFDGILESGISLESNAWHQTSDSVNRLYFGNAGDTVFGSNQKFFFQNGTTTNTLELDGSGNGIFLGNVTAFGSPSDIRLKENIEVIPNALDKVSELRGVTFNYKKDGRKSTGLIAQELEKVLPDVVYETHELGNEEEKFKAVNYGNIVGLLVEAIKELKSEIEELKKG